VRSQALEIELYTKNIFVLYSPGLGGNHVANLLSTDSRYLTKATSIDYANHNKPNAHIIMGNLENVKNAKSIKNNIFCGHLNEFHNLYTENIICKFDNRQIIIIDFPKSFDCLAYKRYAKYSKLKGYFSAEQKMLYSPEIFNKLFNETDFFTVPAEIIFNDSIDSFFDYANYEMNFNLDYTECFQMHNIWIQKIKDYVKQ
jgi:hypothetical protein